MADRELTEEKREKLHDIVEEAGESNRRRDRKHAVVDSNAFREVTGQVGLVFLFVITVVLLKHGNLSPEPFELTLVVTAVAGWGGLVYACLLWPGRVPGIALAFVLSVGVCGMAISHLALGISFDPVAIVFLTGIWLVTGLGIVWIVQKVRRIRAASNTDEADASR